MLIHEVCKECSLTRKAIEYYIEQELVSPTVQENGYRSFTKEDILTLKKISVLRGLGLSITEIRTVLSQEMTTALHEIHSKKALQMSALQEKQTLLGELADQNDWEQVQMQLELLQKKQIILERLMNTFPGSYGKYICFHFAPYLNESVLTDEQQEAFDSIVSFLDNTDFDISHDVKEYLEEVTLNLDEKFAEKISSNMNAAICETEKYLEDNHEIIVNYLSYKQSEEYKASPAYRLETALRQFNEASGYNDIFIPAMCRLSSSYRKYHEGLMKADEKFAQRYS